MNHWTSSALSAASVLLASMFPLVTEAQVREAVTQVSTEATLGSVFGRINESIDQARNAGDYTSVIALVRLKDALDAWKEANSDLLDGAFDKLDKASLENFGRARRAIADANDKTKDRLRTANAITDSANQFVASLPGGRPYVARFEPRVIPPQAKDSFTIRISGVSLDEANPILKLPTIVIKGFIIGPQEVQYTIPLSSIPRNDSTIQVHILNLTYTTPEKGFVAWVTGGTRDVTRQLPLVALPETLASYKIEGSRKFDRRVTMRHTANLGEFRGRNQDIPKVAMPPDGWKWDIGAKDQGLVQGEGIQGACVGILWNESSENGIKAYARVDQVGRSTRYPNGAPGRVNCSLTGTAYKLIPTTEPIKAEVGKIGWLVDAPIELPKDLDLKSLRVTIRVFDGRTRVFTSTDTDRFLDMKVDAGLITFIPKVPEDLLASR